MRSNVAKGEIIWVLSENAAIKKKKAVFPFLHVSDLYIPYLQDKSSFEQTYTAA